MQNADKEKQEYKFILKCQLDFLSKSLSSFLIKSEILKMILKRNSEFDILK